MGVFVGLGHGSGYSVEMFDPRVGRWMFEGLLPPIPVSGIHPDERWHTLWDLVMVALLCFVAVATPVEVAFYSSAGGNAAPAGWDQAGGGLSGGGLPLWYWVWNRVIDLLFVADLVMNFFLGFEDEVEGTVVRDVRVIAPRYARTWFAVDFVSVLPFFIFDQEVRVWERAATVVSGGGWGV